MSIHKGIYLGNYKNYAAGVSEGIPIDLRVKFIGRNLCANSEETPKELSTIFSQKFWKGISKKFVGVNSK